MSVLYTTYNHLNIIYKLYIYSTISSGLLFFSLRCLSPWEDGTHWLNDNVILVVRVFLNFHLFFSSHSRLIFVNITSWVYVQIIGYQKFGRRSYLIRK